MELQTHCEKNYRKKVQRPYRLHLRMSQNLFEELLDKVCPLTQAQNASLTSSQPSSRRLKPQVECLHVRSCLCAGSAAQSPKVELPPTLTGAALVVRLAALLCRITTVIYTCDLNSMLPSQLELGGLDRPSRRGKTVVTLCSKILDGKWSFDL